MGLNEFFVAKRACRKMLEIARKRKLERATFVEQNSTEEQDNQLEEFARKEKLLPEIKINELGNEAKH